MVSASLFKGAQRMPILTRGTKRLTFWPNLDAQRSCNLADDNDDIINTRYIKSSSLPTYETTNEGGSEIPILTRGHKKCLAEKGWLTLWPNLDARKGLQCFKQYVPSPAPRSVRGLKNANTNKAHKYLQKKRLVAFWPHLDAQRFCNVSKYILISLIL